MSHFNGRFRLGRFVWTLLVTFYFLVFFYGFFRDAAPGREFLPIAFAALFVLWLAVEYYFGSPFFQSGVVEPSALWRGVFAFFVYPFLGCLAADYIWWQRAQLPVPALVSGVVGVAVFGFGVWVRLSTLFDVLRIAQYKMLPAEHGRKPVEVLQIPGRRLAGLRLQRLCRQPRYFGTLLQLAGAALVFRSWGGLVVALVVGVPLVIVQARAEESRLAAELGDDWREYSRSLPLLIPRLR